MSEVTTGEWKGKPVLMIKGSPDDKYPFTFGLKKAKLIIENINDIQAFVDEHDKGGS